MKKLFTVLTLCLGMFTVANAQYSPEKGDFAVELGFTPFNTTGGETFKLNEGMLKARYFLNDKNALRLKIGLGIDNKKETTEPEQAAIPAEKTDYFIKNETNTTTNKKTDFSFMLGYERHLFTKGRFDVYAGLELGYGMSKYSGSYRHEATEYNYLSKKLKDYTYTNNYSDYINQDTKNKNQTNRYFAGNLFAGVDVYVWKNLYLGAECGLAFKTGKSPNAYKNENNYTAKYDANDKLTSSTLEIIDRETNTTTTTTVSGGKPDTKTNVGVPGTNETTETSFNFFVEPAIRIGWKF